jgi:RNA polymerase sigma factor (sigma-70 family)
MKARTVDTLVRRAAEGDGEALRDLHRAVMPAVTAFFRRANRVPASAVEELANQTVAEAFQVLTKGRYDERQASFTTFLHGVAYNIRLRYARSRAAAREVAFSELSGDRSAALPDPAAVPTGEEDALDEILVMRDCLFAIGGPADLTPDERYVVIGRANGETYQALADRLGRSLDTVHRLNLHALDKLREGMKSRGFHARRPKNT